MCQRGHSFFCLEGIDILFSDLDTLKVKLKIEPDDTEEDLKLTFFLEEATRWIEEWTGRKDFSKKSRTQSGHV